MKCRRRDIRLEGLGEVGERECARVCEVVLVLEHL